MKVFLEIYKWFYQLCGVVQHYFFHVLYMTTHLKFSRYLCYIPCLLTMFSTSNIADIKDIEEDTLANIQTIPVKFEKDKQK